MFQVLFYTFEMFKASNLRSITEPNLQMVKIDLRSSPNMQATTRSRLSTLIEQSVIVELLSCLPAKLLMQTIFLHMLVNYQGTNFQ